MPYRWIGDTLTCIFSLHSTIIYKRTRRQCRHPAKAVNFSHVQSMPLCTWLNLLVRLVHLHNNALEMTVSWHFVWWGLAPAVAYNRVVSCYLYG